MLITKTISEILAHRTFTSIYYPLNIDCDNWEPTKLIIQVVPLHNSGIMPSTASISLPCYIAFIQYIRHLLTYVVDMR